MHQAPCPPRLRLAARGGQPCWPTTYPLLGVVWSLFIFSILVLWIVTVHLGVHRQLPRHDRHGVAKALWAAVHPLPARHRRAGLHHRPTRPARHRGPPELQPGLRRPPPSEGGSEIDSRMARASSSLTGGGWPARGLDWERRATASRSSSSPPPRSAGVQPEPRDQRAHRRRRVVHADGLTHAGHRLGHGLGVEVAWRGCRMMALARPCGMPVRPPTSWARPWWTPIDAFCRHRPARIDPGSMSARAVEVVGVVDDARQGVDDARPHRPARWPRPRACGRATRPPRRSGPARSCRSRR